MLSPPKTPSMTDEVDEFIFNEFSEEDLDANHNVSDQQPPKGEPVGPASPGPDVGTMVWKLVPIDLDVKKPTYSFLPKPCKYTRYYLKQDPRFSKH